MTDHIFPFSVPLQMNGQNQRQLACAIPQIYLFFLHSQIPGTKKTTEQTELVNNHHLYF